MPDGSKILTDRVSQGLIDRAVGLAEKKPGSLIAFKAVTGWIKIDGPTMLQIGIAVGEHVREMFLREFDADAAIDAGTATTRADVDRILAGG